MRMSFWVGGIVGAAAAIWLSKSDPSQWAERMGKARMQMGSWMNSDRFQSSTHREDHSSDYEHRGKEREHTQEHRSNLDEKSQDRSTPFYKEFSKRGFASGNNGLRQVSAEFSGEHQFSDLEKMVARDPKVQEEVDKILSQQDKDKSSKK